MTTPTDTERVVAWFRSHPGSTVNEAKAALWLHITARMSDAKKAGIVFDQSAERVNGRRVVRFWVRERPVVSGEQVGMGLL